VRAAAQWLAANSDLDKDGKPGWGLPQAWDAFQDGSENPPNTPYTVTTAVVLHGILESLSLRACWEPEEAQALRQLVLQVHLRWCRDHWTEGFGGGFFPYSVRPADAVFCPNAAAMYLGTMARFLHDHPETGKDDERRLIQARMEALAKAVATTVELRDG
jgi:hypothetical protein